MSAFRDSHAEFAGADAQVLGISMDDLETQTRFSDSLKTPFPLLADPEGKTVQAYGVMGGAGPVKYASRVTFVIDKDGKVTDVFEGRDALDPAGALGACKRPK